MRLSPQTALKSFVNSLLVKRNVHVRSQIGQVAEGSGEGCKYMGGSGLARKGEKEAERRVVLVLAIFTRV